MFREVVAHDQTLLREICAVNRLRALSGVEVSTEIWVSQGLALTFTLSEVEGQGEAF